MREVSIAVTRALDDLEARYCQALDSGDMPAWLSTFSEDAAASYVCISAENDKAGMRIALMLDDCRARLVDRVTIVTRVWAGTFQPYTTRHFTQRIRCDVEPDGTVRATSNFSVFMTPEGAPSSVLAVGCYVDRIRIGPERACLLERRAVYDTNVLPRYVVYPL